MSDEAGVELDSAPPTKDALLVCKQIYAEQKKKQATTYRRYWTTQRFLLIADRNIRKELHLASKADLQHICRIAVHCLIEFWNKALVTFRFDARSAWAVDIEAPRSVRAPESGFVLWFLTECPRRDKLLEDLEEMMDTLREDRGVNEYFELSTVDPTAGQGLDANKLNRLPSKVRRYQ